jgi:nucleoside-diphosphate kinase
MSRLAILDATDWSAWSVVLLKPDCLERGLVDEVLDRIAPHAAIIARQVVTVTEAQMFAHYDDLLQHPEWVAPVDPGTDLRRRYVGHQVITALARGPAAGPSSPGPPALLRGLLGHFDPAQATRGSIRGHFGTDSLATARAEGRLIDNLIHTSDHPAAARRDFLIWFGLGRATLLTPVDLPEPRHDHASRYSRSVQRRAVPADADARQPAGCP